jgi:putative phosphoribosyl transferase
MIFANREAAANQLAEALSEYNNKHSLIIAIPRDVVPIARINCQGIGW